MAPWEVLWPRAMACIASLEGHFPLPDWIFGGGTALMLLYGHRRARTSTSFCAIRNTLRPLPAIERPYRGPHRALCGAVQFPEAHLRWRRSEFHRRPGPDDSYMTKTVLGTETKVETPVEIVATKVFYTHRVQDIGVGTEEGSELDHPPPHPLPLGGGISYWTADISSPPDGRGLRGGRSKIVTSRARTYRKPKRDGYVGDRMTPAGRPCFSGMSIG